MSKLTISVNPLNRQELIEASSMLENLAFRLDKVADEDGKKPESSAASVNTAAEQDTQNTTTSEASVQTATDAGTSGDNQQQQETPEGVTLADGIPWDPRIHASSKTTLAKAPNGWKLKRGVSTELVAEVEKELRDVMAASPTKPIETTTAKPKIPTIPKKPSIPKIPAPVKYLVEGTPYTADELKAFGPEWTDDVIATLEVVEPEAPAETATEIATTDLTFPQLLAKITAGKADETIDDAAVTAACNAQGLESIQLAGARPDLQPAILKALFG